MRVKFQFTFTTVAEIGSQHLLVSNSSNVLPERGSKKAFNKCQGVSNVFPQPPKPEFGFSCLFLGLISICGKVLNEPLKGDGIVIGKYLKHSLVN